MIRFINKGGGIDTSDATATPNDILKPKTAYINGEKVEGAIEAQYKTTTGEGNRLTKNIQIGDGTNKGRYCISADKRLVGYVGNITSSSYIPVYVYAYDEVTDGYKEIYKESYSKFGSYITLRLFSLGFDKNKDCVGFYIYASNNKVSTAEFTFLYNIKTKILTEGSTNIPYIRYLGSYYDRNSENIHFIDIFNGQELGIMAYNNTNDLTIYNYTKGIKFSKDISLSMVSPAVTSTHFSSVLSQTICLRCSSGLQGLEYKPVGKTHIVKIDWDTNTILREKTISSVFIPTKNLDYVLENDEIKKLTMDSESLEYTTISFNIPIKISIPLEDNYFIYSVNWINSNELFVLLTNLARSKYIYTIYKIDYEQYTITPEYEFETTNNTSFLEFSVHSNEGKLVLAEVTDDYSNIQITYDDTLEVHEKLESFKVNGTTYQSLGDTSGSKSDLLEGKTMYNYSGIVSGTMPDNGELNYTPSTENQQIPLGYTSGGIVDGDENLIPENIVSGKSIFNVEGIAEIGIDTSSDNPITAKDVINEKEGFVNGEKVVGTLDLSNLLPENIKAGITINGIEGTYSGESATTSEEVDS